MFPAGAALLLLTASCLVEIREPVGGGAGGNGQAGGAASGAAGGAGGGAVCPEDMLHISDGADVSYCIDKTEVTREAYVLFLAAVSGPPATAPASCAGNTSLINPEDGTCPDFTSATQLPVNCVDWCDAHAYCSWRGKRLCRALNGSSMTFADTPVGGEWFYACSGGRTKTFPYGDTPDPDACNIPGNSNRVEVATFPGCEGGFDGIFDMVGNVAEWIDACEDDTPGARCKVRGGHTFGAASQWTCDDDDVSELRSDASVREVGIRCCADPM